MRGPWTREYEKSYVWSEKREYLPRLTHGTYPQITRSFSAPFDLYLNYTLILCTQYEKIIAF